MQFHGWYEDPTKQYIYLAMEYAQYSDLGEYLKDNALEAKSQVISITRQLVKSLSILHGKGISHCDLKPKVPFRTLESRPSSNTTRTFSSPTYPQSQSNSPTSASRDPNSPPTTAPTSAHPTTWPPSCSGLLPTITHDQQIYGHWAVSSTSSSPAKPHSEIVLLIMRPRLG